MATGSTGEIRTLLFDDFSVSPSSAVWDYNHFSATDNPSFYGRTQIRQGLPIASDGLLHLQLDSYNPTAQSPGDSFYGSEIISNQTFAPSNAGGIAFEVSARIVTPAPGLVGGIFGYNFNNATRLHSEVDFELLGNDAAAGAQRDETNVYSNEPLGTGHPQFVPANDRTVFHKYRIEWFSDRVRWLIDDQLVREDTAHVPQGALALHLNIWAPTEEWPEAFSSTLQPAGSAAANASYIVDVDYARVALLGPARSSAPSVKAIADFNGDGTSDILWQRNDGTLMVFDIDNNRVSAAPIIGQLGAEWHADGIGDFNNDGTSDILWQRTNGTLMVFDIDNNRVSAAPIVGLVGAEWHLAGIGDFNNDGTSDILWQRTDGMLMVFDINNNQVSAAPIIGQLGAEWRLAGIGDFNNDGTSDILWQRTEGTLTVFDLTNNQVSAAPIIGQIGAEWHLTGIGDFNNDGTSDILWQRPDGTLMVFDLTNNQVSAAPIIGQIGAEWHAAGIGDFNKDGTSDILWQRTDGTLTVFDINNNQVIAAPIIGQVGAEWHLFA